MKLLQMRVAMVIASVASVAAPAAACPPPLFVEAPMPPPAPPPPPPPMLPGETQAAYDARLARDWADYQAVFTALASAFPRAENESGEWYQSRLRLLAQGGDWLRRAGEGDEAYGARLDAAAAAIAARSAAAQASLAAENQRRKIAAQAEMIEAADSVVIARAIKRRRIGDSMYLDQLSAVTFMPVRWIRGTRQTSNITLRHTGDTSCGPIGPLAAEARVGDTWVLFFKGKKKVQANLMQEIHERDLVEPRLTKR